MSISKLEQSLVEWAGRNRFVGISPDGKTTFDVIPGEAPSETEEDEIFRNEDYSRIIATPSGCIEWEVFLKRGVKEDYPPENLFMYYGPKIQNWRSGSFSKEDREANALLRISVGLEDPRFIRGSDFDVSLVNIRKYIASTDPLYMFLGQMKGNEGAHEQLLGGLTMDLSAIGVKQKTTLRENIRFDKNDTTIDPRWGGREYGDFNWVPRTEEHYRLILDKFAEVIARRSDSVLPCDYCGPTHG